MARLWPSVRSLPLVVQLLAVVAVVALVWSVSAVFTGDDDGSETVVNGGSTTTTAATPAAGGTGPQNTAPGTSTTPGAGPQAGAGAAAATTVAPDGGQAGTDTTVPADETIEPTGDPVTMEPTEACPSGQYVEILGLLVCSEP